MPSDIPVLSVDQMRAVDRNALEEYGYSVTRLMEHAGYHVADRVRAGHDAETVHVYAGSGNNGGDGLVAARFLHNWGYDVRVILPVDDVGGVRAEERAILDRIGVVLSTTPPETAPDLVIDALLGYGLNGPPRAPFDTCIDEINAIEAPVVSVDVPSGVDADTGEGLRPHVDADETVTVGLPTTGLERSDVTGTIWLADIGIPPQAYAVHDIDPERVRNLFADRSLVRVSL